LWISDFGSEEPSHRFGLHFVAPGGLRYNHFDLLEMID
jgi:hypothetical protein